MGTPQPKRPPNPLRKSEVSIDVGTIRDSIKTGKKVLGRLKKNRGSGRL